MKKNTIRIAIWKPSDMLLQNIKKLNFSNEIIGVFDDEIEDGKERYRKYTERDIQTINYDFVLIPFENFRNTKKYLNEMFGIPLEIIFTFEEYWVKDCEKIIVNQYHNRWEKIWQAQIGIFNGKTVVIVGGSSGIGKECAYCFLLNGANVIIAGRNIEKMQWICNEYGKYGNIKCIQWDVNDVIDYKEKFTELKDVVDGSIDILVNSAGIWDSSCADFFAVEEIEFDNIINTNLKAAYFLCQIFAKYFMENKIRGHIVNVASNVGTLPTVKPYGLSKWGLIGLTRGLGHHLAEYGITVNAVAPGAVATPLADWQEGDCPARRASRSGRIAFPCEIAEVILNLAGYTGENFIGEVLVCDGGDKSISMKL